MSVQCLILIIRSILHLDSYIDFTVFLIESVPVEQLLGFMFPWTLRKWSQWRATLCAEIITSISAHGPSPQCFVLSRWLFQICTHDPKSSCFCSFNIFQLNAPCWSRERSWRGKDRRVFCFFFFLTWCGIIIACIISGALQCLDLFFFPKDHGWSFPCRCYVTDIRPSIWLIIMKRIE